MDYKKTTVLFLLCFSVHLFSQQTLNITEKSPSRSNYFDWINSEWPGSCEEKILANLEFFAWLKAEYGMQLDIYHMDAGNIDQSPNWAEGANSWKEGILVCYGSTKSDRFKRKFPHGFQPIVDKAAEIHTRMGIWLGPDGYGQSNTEAMGRQDMLISFCRDYNFVLFKFDAACTNIDPFNEKYFIETMQKCRSYTPDLITLNHRIKLSDAAKKEMTTWLWEGQETYVDVHIWNESPAPHHRAGALSRGLPPNLSRLTEDHGVCLSSCLDYWDDDLILQAFNRNLILAPEIYGNPWLLKDDEFSRLARIYNIAEKYKEILVNGMVLPEQYGRFAVSRGDDKTRLLTLRNLSWQPQTIEVNLDRTIGLSTKGRVLVKQLHPTEKLLGTPGYGKKIEVTVMPFRSCLILVTSERDKEWSLRGCDYWLTRDVPGKQVIITLLGYPGTSAGIKLENRKFKNALIDGIENPKFAKGKGVTVDFAGEKLEQPFLRKIGELLPCDFPRDVEAMYEVSCFAADNNALEVRSLARSGETKIPQVEKARQSFFNDMQFVSKGVWDRYAFDGNPRTFFAVRDYSLKEFAVFPGAFRLDVGEPQVFDEIVFQGTEKSFYPQKIQISQDLLEWHSVNYYTLDDYSMRIKLNRDFPFRYMRIEKTPQRVAEIIALKDGKKVDCVSWRASNLFAYPEDKVVKRTWRHNFVLQDIAPNSYLDITVPGSYDPEGAWAAIKIDGQLYGAPDRAPSYECNHWEHAVRRVNGNYTFYFPISPEIAGKNIEAYVLGCADRMNEVYPEVWINAYPVPFVEKKVVLY